MSDMIRQTSLSNGIRVVVEEMPFVRSVAFGLWIKCGSINETPENNGIAHMIEHMLFKGTKSRSAKELADIMTDLGGNMNAFTAKECTSFYAKVLDIHITQMIEIVADMVCNSVFDEKDIKKEKGVILEEIDMYDDSPEDMVHEMLQEKIWENNSLGYIISGPKKNVRKFTRQDIIDFMNVHYVAENMVISIAGNCKLEDIKECLEENFGKVRRRSVETEIVWPSYNRSFLKVNKDIEQAHLNIAFDTFPNESEDRYVLTVANAIIGGSLNSLLFQHIREELGLTYSIYSYGSTFEKAGLFHIYAAMNPSQTEKVMENTFKVIEGYNKEIISEEELSKVKEQISTELILNYEGTESRMNSNAKSLLFKDHIITLDETVERIKQVSLEELREYSGRYLDISAASVCVIGNFAELNIKGIKNMWKQL